MLGSCAGKGNSPGATVLVVITGWVFSGVNRPALYAEAFEELALRISLVATVSVESSVRKSEAIEAQKWPEGSQFCGSALCASRTPVVTETAAVATDPTITREWRTPVATLAVL